MKRIRCILSVITMSLCSTAVAQQDVMYTQYMFNGLAFNPAYAGSHEATSLAFLWRRQWLNIPGAPQSFTLGAHTPLGGKKIGFGIQAAQDRLGVSNQTSANASLSYMLAVSDQGVLSFGLSAGLDKLDFNFKSLQLGQTVDATFDPSQSIDENKANVGAGLYYSSDRSFIGISVPRLIENEFGNADGASFVQKRHLFVYAGHVFDLHPNLKFKPNVLFKAVEGAELQVDLNANFLFVDKLWLGVSYRSFESVDLLAQYMLTDQFGIGYAYDINLNGLRDYNSGSHEVVLNYLFSFRKKTMLTPRYF